MIILLILPHIANTIIPTASSICDSWMIVSNFARLSYLIWIFHIPFCMLLLAHQICISRIISLISLLLMSRLALIVHLLLTLRLGLISHLICISHFPRLSHVASCASYHSYCTCSASILCVARILQLNLLTSPILLLSRKIYWDQDYI